ncbi:MAG: HAD hydrolase family protein [Merdibacter sp.]
MQQLQVNGHFVAIATGRAHYKARRFMEESHCTTWSAAAVGRW